MSKRFIDTEMTLRPWFRALKPKIKCLWLWMLTRCDMAGVIDMDWDLASFAVGEKVTPADMAALNGNALVLGGLKVFIPGFIPFQYGELKAESRVHQGVLSCLASHGLRYPIDLNTYPINSLSGVLDTPKDKDKDKDKDSSGGVGDSQQPINPPIKGRAFSIPTLDEVKAYVFERHSSVDPERFWSFYESNGWKVGKNHMKSWKAAIVTWERGDGGRAAKPLNRTQATPPATIDYSKGF